MAVYADGFTAGARHPIARYRPGAPAAVRLATALLVGLVSLYLLTMGGHTYAPDDESFYYVAESMATRGAFDMPDPRVYPTVGGRRGLDGRFYAQGGLGQSLLALPFYVAGRALATAAEPRFAGVLTRFVVGMFNPLVTALAAVVLFGYARTLGFRLRAAAALALIWALATYVWIEAKTFYNEPLMGLGLLLAFWCVARARAGATNRWLAASGLAWGLAAVTRFHALFALPPLLLYAAAVLWKKQGRDWAAFARSALAFVVPAGLVAGLGVLGYNVYRFGDPSELGYGGSPVTVPYLEGLYGLLFSPGKSFFLYAPPAIFGVLAFSRFFRKHRVEACVFALYIAICLLYYPRIEFWHSDGTWGNRYLYPTLPFWILPGGILLESIRRQPARLFTGLVVTAGVLVQLLAVPINFDAYLNMVPGETMRFFNPAYSPIVGHARLLEARVGAWWQAVVAPPPERVLLLDGWLASDGGPDELFPRYAASRARVVVYADPNEAVHLRILLADPRPNGQPRRALEVRAGDMPVELLRIPAPQGSDLAYAASIAAPHSNRLWLEFDTAGTRPQGSSPMGDELGFQVQDLAVQAGGATLDLLPDLSIPPIPVAIPKAAWGWYFNPKLPHFDFWFWYLFFSGLPFGLVAAITLPLLCACLLGLIFAVRWLGQALSVPAPEEAIPEPRPVAA